MQLFTQPALLGPGEFFEDDLTVAELECVEPIRLCIEMRLQGGEHEWSMGRHEDLRAHLMAEIVKNLEQCGDDVPLPFRVQVRLGLVEENDHAIGRASADDPRGLYVLGPHPGDEIGEAEDALHPRRGVVDRYRLVRELDRGELADVIEVEPHRLSRHHLLFRVREAPEHARQELEWLRLMLIVFELPCDPILNQAITYDLVVMFEPVP